MANNNPYTDVPTQLVINKMTRAKYDQLCAQGLIDADYELFLVEDTVFDVFGNRVVNVGYPLNQDDGVNVQYANDKFVPKDGASDYVDFATRILQNNSVLSTDTSICISSDFCVYKRGMGDQDWDINIEGDTTKTASDITISYMERTTNPGWVFVVNGLTGEFGTGKTSKNEYSLTSTVQEQRENFKIYAYREKWTKVDEIVKKSEIYCCLSNLTESSQPQDVLSALLSLKNKMH